MEENFWERIESLTSGSYTKKQLAADCGIAVNTIASWKMRKNYPSAEIAVKIAKSLRVSVEFLITGEDSKLLPERYRNLCKLMEDLSEQDIMEIEALVQIKSSHSMTSKERLA